MFQNHLESWKKTDFCPPFKIYWTWTRLRCASSPIRILCLQSRENCRKGRYLSLCLDLKIATFKLTKIVSLGEKCLERTLSSEITSLKALSSLPQQVIMESLILRWCKKSKSSKTLETLSKVHSWSSLPKFVFKSIRFNHWTRPKENFILHDFILHFEPFYALLKKKIHSAFNIPKSILTKNLDLGRLETFCIILNIFILSVIIKNKFTIRVSNVLFISSLFSFHILSTP